MRAGLRVVLGVYCIFIGLITGWLAWRQTLAESGGSVALLVATAILGGLGSMLAVPPALAPRWLRRSSPPLPGSAARTSFIVLSLFAVIVTVAGGTFIHRKIPVISAEGVAGVAPDGRLAVIDHGAVVRYISEQEYRALQASGLAAIATVANALLTVFLVAIATRFALTRSTPGVSSTPH